MKEKIKQIKDENKILIMLAFFSISIGLWGNFRQLWLQNNELSVTQISNILSLGTFICAIAILIISKKITLNKLRNFISTALIIKIINLIILFLCNNTDYIIIIKLLFIFDIIIERLIIISIYPFIVTIKKDNHLYSKRKLVEYLFKDFGILVGGLLIGKVIFGMLIDYNMCLLISIMFLLISFVLMLFIKQPDTQENTQNGGIIKYIFSNTLVKTYLICYFVANIAMYTGLGLKMLMFTNILNFSDSNATNYFLIVGLFADLIGILALRYFTPRNDYVTITIKFGIRFLSYTIAFLSNNTIIVILAITWSILISTAYENVTDAPYINVVPNNFQVLFTDIRYIVGVLAESIGVFFAGIMYNYGIRYMLGLSAFFMIFQLILSYRLIYIRHHNNYTKME